MFWLHYKISFFLEPTLVGRLINFMEEIYKLDYKTIASPQIRLQKIGFL